MIKKYKMLGGNLGGKGSPLVYREVAMDKVPDPRLLEHVQLPPSTSRDIVTFGAKYVESRENLNRAYFANDELLAAYHTIPYKALDVEHNVEEVVGHIYSSVFVNRKTNQAIDPEVALKLPIDELNKIDIDVIVGGVVYADRFPMLEGPVNSKAYKISMETYFDSFDILLENGVKLSFDEAVSLGLSEFIDQLMGSFESQDEFDKAHSLLVTVADNKQMKMKIYKYLRGLLFSGGGLVLNPACPSCAILSTSGDVEEEEFKVAASTEFSLDLRKYDPYMKEQKLGKPRVHQVTEGLDCPCNDKPTEQAEDFFIPVSPSATPVNPPTGVGNPTTPRDFTSFPMACPQYQLDANMWCIYADKQCVTAGDRTFKDCHRWFRDDERGWLFDTRNTSQDLENIVVNENLDNDDPKPIDNSGQIDDQQSKLKPKYQDSSSMKYVLQAAEYGLEAWEIEKEIGGAWTAKVTNELPNSSFAVVETGYKGGMDKNARHLAFKDSEGNVNITQLRKALLQIDQIKNTLGNDTDSDLRSRAQAKLAPYVKRLLKSDKEGD
jgi:hypothetical protein